MVPCLSPLRTEMRMQKGVGGRPVPVPLRRRGNNAGIGKAAAPLFPRSHLRQARKFPILLLFHPFLVAYKDDTRAVGRAQTQEQRLPLALSCSSGAQKGRVGAFPSTAAFAPARLHAKKTQERGFEEKEATHSSPFARKWGKEP